MSINLNHTNDTITTTSSQITLPGVIVPANSDGNVSRWVMDTAQSGASTIGHWAELATITPPVTTYITLSGTLYLSSKNTIAQRNAIVDFQIIQDAAGLNGTTSKISVRSLDGAMLSADNFMFTAAAATNGTAIKLHIQTDVDYGYFAVSEIHTSDKTGWSIAYNNGATWSATTPTGAVTVTSDWARYSTYAPTVQGTTTAGVGTYNVQAGHYIISNGICTGKADVAWTAHTGTGDLAIILPVAPRHPTRGGIHIHRMVGLTRPDTNPITTYFEAGSSTVFIKTNSAAGAETAVAMDTAVTLLTYSFSYPVA